MWMAEWVTRPTPTVRRMTLRATPMRTMLLSAVAALSLGLAAAPPAQAQVYYSPPYNYYPNTGYLYGYPGAYYGAYPGVRYSYYYSNPYVYGFYPGYNTRYYYWNWYNPYTNQYRTWRWYRSF